MDLAQAVVAVEEQARLLGLTVSEWVILLPAIGAFLAAIIQTWHKAKGARKLLAVLHAIEETAEEHPEAAKVVKRLVKEKATKLSVEAGLNKDVRKVTMRRKNGGKL